jgi:hypothetical protein
MRRSCHDAALAAGATIDSALDNALYQALDQAPAVTRSGSGFKGNKAALPSKPCAACGRPMTWRRAWAKNWDEVRYCSEACRKRRQQGSSHEPC